MSERDARSVKAATQALALLHGQADEVRAELEQLRDTLAKLRNSAGASRAVELLQANEQLVLAALHAETIAETAVRNLDALTHSSQRDPLTDTPNRTLMFDRFEHAITVAKRRKTHLAVFFIDLDKFKKINDTFGHPVGDQVLQLVARRLESAVRDSDTVSRHGGEEFLVLLDELPDIADVASKAAHLLATLAEPGRIGTHEFHLSASLGIALYPDDGTDPNALIHCADAAMYRAKRRGGGGFVFCHDATADDDSGFVAVTNTQAGGRPSMHTPLPERETRLQSLREANEHLLLAALSAQEQEAHAKDAHGRQLKFMAMVAHELRNPLTPIRIAAGMLDRARSDMPQFVRLQEIIEGQVTHIARLVDDLLDGSRISMGKLRLERSRVDMSRVLDVALETCRPGMAARLQQLTVQLRLGAPSVHGDPVRLVQVFSNLLDNASKYTPDGGRIELAADVSGETMVVTVSDNGIGITAEALPHIFDLFVQDTHAMALRKGGLGIGLAVVRELVEAHGGSVVGSSAGKDCGSTFVVTLPVSGPAAAARGGEDPASR